MASTQVVIFDTIRSIAFGSISGSYAAVGAAFALPVRLIMFLNNTNGDVFLSTNGVDNMLFLPADSFQLFDMNTNRTNQDQYWVLPAGTQIYVKQSSAPTSGAVYVECLHAQT